MTDSAAFKKPNYRMDKISMLLKKTLSQILLREMEDLKVGSDMITVSEVVVSKDLSNAKVYVSIFTSDKDQQSKTLERLKNAAGFLRSRLLDEVKLRNIPKLFFYLDESIEYGTYLTRLIDEANKSSKDS